MTDAWNSLKWDFEEVEAPASLKSEVMNFVFEQEKKTLQQHLRNGAVFAQAVYSLNIRDRSIGADPIIFQ
ncbi:hypothetical protein ACI2OX_07290 [Bacillus sp. N9]